MSDAKFKVPEAKFKVPESFSSNKIIGSSTVKSSSNVNPPNKNVNKTGHPTASQKDGETEVRNNLENENPNPEFAKPSTKTSNPSVQAPKG